MASPDSDAPAPDAGDQPENGPRSHAGDSEPTVVLEGVDRHFGAKPAVADLSFIAPAGAITAMLGPNGAGKTTALRLVTGALAPDRGQIRVFGLDPATPEGGETVRRLCGVVTAKPSLYDRLSGLDNLRYAAQLYGLGRGTTVDDRLREAAGLFGIADALDQAVGGYSTGMKTRLALARAVAHGPELLLLDEPTSGLDPESAASVLELVRLMTGHGRTVILCTHLLAEADGLADHVVVLERGTAVAAGDPRELSAGFWPHPQVRFEADNGPDLDRLAHQPGVLDYARQQTRALVSLDDEARVGDLIMALSGDGVRLRAVEPCRPRLEDLYFAIQALRRGQEEAASPPPDRKAEEEPPLVAPAPAPVPASSDGTSGGEQTGLPVPAPTEASTEAEAEPEFVMQTAEVGR